MILYFTPEMWRKLRYYVQQCKTEISGLGTIEQQGKNFVVTDLVILEQTVSSTSSDMKEEALDKFTFEQTKKKDIGRWRLWWHSHADMKAFFSGTDDATIESSTEYDWFISLVTNHKMETVAQVDQHRPFRASEDLKIEVLATEDVKLQKACFKEIEDLVHRETHYQTKYLYGKECQKTEWQKEQDKKADKEMEEIQEENLEKSTKLNFPWKDKKIKAVYREDYGVEGTWLKICHKDGSVQWTAYNDFADLPKFKDVKKKK